MSGNNVDTNQTIETTDQLPQAQANRQELLQSIAQLAQAETNPQKAQTLTELAPKVIDMFHEMQPPPTLQDLTQRNPDTWLTVFQTALATLSASKAQGINEMFADPKNNGALASFFEARFQKSLTLTIKAQQVNKIKNDNESLEDVKEEAEKKEEETNEKVTKSDKKIDWLEQIRADLKQQIADTEKSKADAISKNGLEVASAETLDASLTTTDQQIAFATDQLGYDQAQATEIVNNYNNSQYSEAWLSIGQLLSFLQTEQALWNNGIDSDPFLADVAKIRDDLQISAPKTKKTELDI